MEPRVQYAQTTDGVSIAYATLSEGAPLVHLPFPFSHVQLEWQIPEVRSYYERLAEERMLVRYDERGLGLSQRDVADVSLDARVLDLEAVVDRLGVETFALFGPHHSGPTAIAYAARYPERVSHLVLWCTYSHASGWARGPKVQATRSLLDQDWGFYTESAAQALLGWSAGEPARRFAALMRESATPEAVDRAVRALNQIDVTALLPQVTSPTLVLHRRQVEIAVDVARGLASRIPDARLALLEGESVAPYLGDTEAVLEAIDEFLGEPGEAAGGAEAAEAGLVHTILFTDVEGSTALTQRLGDAKARAVLREHERIVREALKGYGGSEMKMTGDGFMASFSSAVRALESAIAMQRAFAAHNQSTDEPIRVRVGMNAGEPIAEDDPDGRSDLFGAAVIRAARIAALAKGGEILVSNVVRELAEGKEFLFSDRGEVTLRGFDDPIRLYELRWQEAK